MGRDNAWGHSNPDCADDELCDNCLDAIPKAATPPDKPLSIPYYDDRTWDELLGIVKQRDARIAALEKELAEAKYSLGAQTGFNKLVTDERDTLRAEIQSALEKLEAAKTALERVKHVGCHPDVYEQVCEVLASLGVARGEK